MTIGSAEGTGPRRAVVVGADGFLGTSAVRALRRSDVEVTLFTRQRSFLDHPDELTAADTIFWLASSIRPATTSTDPHAGDADHSAMRTLLDRLDRAPDRGRARVVVVSSGGTVYDGRASPPHDEDAPTAPANAYGDAMLNLEGLIGERAPEAVVLRVANAYGPGQRARGGQGVIAHWMPRIARGEPITVLGHDDLVRDYVYIDDVADALVKVHAAASVPGVLNIGSGAGTGLGALVDAVTEAVAPTPVHVERSRARDFDAPSTWLDVGRARREIGWAPRTGLHDGLTATWRAGVPVAAP